MCDDGRWVSDFGEKTNTKIETKLKHSFGRDVDAAHGQDVYTKMAAKTEPRREKSHNETTRDDQISYCLVSHNFWSLKEPKKKINCRWDRWACKCVNGVPVSKSPAAQNVLNAPAGNWNRTTAYRTAVEEDAKDWRVTKMAIELKAQTERKWPKKRKKFANSHGRVKTLWTMTAVTAL